jgi:hypothetical protein
MDSLQSNHFHPIARLMVRMAIVVWFFPIMFRASGTGVKTAFPAQTSKGASSIVMTMDSLLFFPLIAGGNQPIYNGDFELGPDQTGNPVGWTAYNSGGAQGLAHSLVNAPPSFFGIPDPNIPMGKYSMLLGSIGYACDKVPIGFVAIDQTIRIPNVSDDVPVNLVFAYIIYTQDLSTLSQPDRFEVHIKYNANDNLVYLDRNLTNQAGCEQKDLTRIPPSPGAWQTGTVNLESPVDFRGKTVTISFQDWNSPDQLYNTLTYLDSVQIKVGP